MSPDLSLSAMSDSQRRAVEEELAEFEKAWNDKLLATRLRELPVRGDPLRPVMLAALTRADLRLRWARGQKVSVEAYLKACPELGTAATVPLGLIVAEYEARAEAGVAIPLADLLARFPQRAAELRQRLEGTCVSDTSALAGGAGETAVGPPPRTHGAGALTATFRPL